jgi:hypothetical protein
VLLANLSPQSLFSTHTLLVSFLKKLGLSQESTQTLDFSFLTQSSESSTSSYPQTNSRPSSTFQETHSFSTHTPLSLPFSILTQPGPQTITSPLMNILNKHVSFRTHTPDSFK